MTKKTEMGKNIWCWNSVRQIDQWNRMEIPKTDPLDVQSQVALQVNGEMTEFNKWCWHDWVTTQKIMKLDLYFHVK